MTRAQLEHLLRAAGDICQEDEFIVIGSQAILGQFPMAPPPLLTSMEADLIPRHRSERADLIDGTIGELSPFHETYGYYAQGVAERTAVLPEGWRTRLVEIRNDNTRGVAGHCLEVHDLLIAKLVAGRDKDRRFFLEAVRHGLAREQVLLTRLAETPIAESRRDEIAAIVRAQFRESGAGGRKSK